MVTLPSTLALIDDDSEFVEFLAQYLREQGIKVDVFPDSDDLLTTDAPYGYDFYVVDLMLPGVDGIQLIRLLRRRTNVGIVVISGKVTPDVFRSVIDAQADMYLSKPVSFEQVLLTIRAICRRTAAMAQVNSAWQLDRRASLLIAPDTSRIELSGGDMTVMECLLEAHGQPVAREVLIKRLGRNPSGADDNWLHGTIYRLRRRIERATVLPVPLQSVARVGYEFKAELRAI
ncbi:response regulator transcription factor [Sphaerotilus montanus]|uniref:DNA-binding response OmpR family regulator n=1 Tax=Sphaerotilus montanus TaxID=522889 RepID=A0A7Y9R1E8_9BURK|nr:response regulator transcription factor [Sphaerotilus montanus]NYG35452.1 DNA-binding response OmpR family regulator [Sphaerotilus montanus]NZD57199.1 response regulator transcription factor [Sphaerotilus montanus]